MERYFSIRKASEILGIKVRTVREWAKNGKIKAIKYPNSNMWFISENEIMTLISEGIAKKDDNKD